MNYFLIFPSYKCILHNFDGTCISPHIWALKKLSLSPLGQIVLLDLLIPWVLSVTRCAASACRVSYDTCRVSYDIIGNPTSCTMDDIIKSGKNKIKDLDADAVDADINSKFKQLHMSHFSYMCKTEGENRFSHLISTLCINCKFTPQRYSGIFQNY